MKWSLLGLGLVSTTAFSLALPAQARQNNAIAAQAIVIRSSVCSRTDQIATDSEADFWVAVLNATTTIANRIETPVDKAIIFSQLGLHYACLGQREPALAHIQQALTVAQTLEATTPDDSSKASRTLFDISKSIRQRAKRYCPNE